MELSRDTDVIASAFIKKALEWPTIRNTDTKLLDEFALFLVECQIQLLQNPQSP
jgi:hypothetical protein